MASAPWLTAFQRSAAASVFFLLTGMVSAAPLPPTPAGMVTLPLANVWSFHARSSALLGDLSYAIDYLFEFSDEEELQVHATGPGAEILEGMIRTIIDGDPILATILVRGEQLRLQITRDQFVFVASWIQTDRLVAADLPIAEVMRRWMQIMRLLRETRRRLGLEQFHPARDDAATLLVRQLDVLELTPTKDTPQHYEIVSPGTPAARESLITAIDDGSTWEITWGDGHLVVRIAPPADSRAAAAEVHYSGTGVFGTQGGSRLSRAESRRLVSKALSFLQDARIYFGTSPITVPLPPAPR